MLRHSSVVVRLAGSCLGAALCVLCVGSLARAQSVTLPEGVLFYASGDSLEGFYDQQGPLKPLRWSYGPNPLPAPTLSDNAYRGKSLVLGAPGGVTIPLEGHWSPARGSLELRLCLPEIPPDQPFAGNAVVVGNAQIRDLQVVGVERKLVPVKDAEGKETGEKTVEFRVAGQKLATPWQAGEWHHLVYTWDSFADELFLDGKSVARWPAGRHFLRLPEPHDKLPVTITFGGSNWNYRYPPQGFLFDEVRIYSWPMGAAEAAQAAASPQAAALPLPENRRFVVKDDIWGPGEQAVLCHVDCYNHPAYQRKQLASVRVEILNKAGKAVGSDVLSLLPEGLEQKLIRASALPPGAYSLRATALDAVGKPLLKATTPPHTVKSYPWLFNKLGDLPGVPAPFTPVTATTQQDRLTVGVWGREYRLGPSGLPVAVKSNDRELLAGPVQLQWTSGDRQGTLSGGKRTTVKQTPERVEWQSTGIACAGGTAEVWGWLEYDGVSYLNLKLTPPAGRSLDLTNLTLDIPIAKPHARLAHSVGWNTFWWYGTRALLSPQPGQVYSSAEHRQQGDPDFFSPYVWIGDDDRGLAWFAESPRNWHTDTRNTLTAVRDETGIVHLRVPMITLATKLTRPTDFKFGFIATPVKPLPPRWRAWRLGDVYFFDQAIKDYAQGQLYTWIWADPNNQAINFSGSFNVGPDDPTGEKWVETFGGNFPTGQPKRGSYPVPFTNLHLVNPAPEIWPDYPDFAGEMQADGWAMSPTQSFQDFWVWRSVNPWAKRKAIGGLYIDEPYCSGVNWSTNPFCGAWFDEEGRAQPSWCLLRERLFLKRILLAQRQCGLPGMIWLHMTANYYPHAFTHVTAAMDGEVGSGISSPEEDVIGYWIHGWMRSTNSGHATGLLPLNMGSNIRSQSPLLWRPFTGLCYAHDVLCTGNGYWYPHSKPAELARVAFDIANDDVRFLGYWDNTVATVKLASGAAAPTPAEDLFTAVYGPPDAAGKREHPELAKDNPYRVYVSLHYRPDRALVTILNHNDNEAIGELVLDPKWWSFVKDWQITDAESGEKLTGDRDRIPFAVKSRDFRLLWVGPRP